MIIIIIINNNNNNSNDSNSNNRNDNHNNGSGNNENTKTPKMLVSVVCVVNTYDASHGNSQYPLAHCKPKKTARKSRPKMLMATTKMPVPWFTKMLVATTKMPVRWLQHTGTGCCRGCRNCWRVHRPTVGCPINEMLLWTE